MTWFFPLFNLALFCARLNWNCPNRPIFNYIQLAINYSTLSWKGLYVYFMDGPYLYVSVKSEEIVHLLHPIDMSHRRHVTFLLFCWAAVIRSPSTMFVSWRRLINFCFTIVVSRETKKDPNGLKTFQLESFWTSKSD